MKVYTRTAGVIDLDCPTDIRRLELDDLWRSLYTRYRYGNQVTHPVTVAEHSWLVQGLAAIDGQDPETCYQCRLHDISEGLLGDLQKPIRDMLPADCSLERAHAAINREVARRHGWDEDWHCSEVVRRFDNRAFELEVFYCVPPERWHQFISKDTRLPTQKEEDEVVKCLRLPHSWSRWKIQWPSE